MFDVRRHYLKEKVRQMFTGHINKTVKNPETAKKLTPTYDMGCKRITPSDTYLQVYVCMFLQVVEYNLYIQSIYPMLHPFFYKSEFINLK